MLSSASEQVAADLNCAAYDFFLNITRITVMTKRPGQRVFSEKPSVFRAATFGKNVVISAAGSLMDFADKLTVFEGTKLFDGGGISAVNKFLTPRGYFIGSVNQYYLPSDSFRVIDPQGYDLQLLTENDIRRQLYPYYPGFGNALLYRTVESRKDVLAVIAQSGRTLLGIAGASSDSEVFWQIGVDIIPEFRGKGLGPVLVSTLANEILLRGRIPYYGTWPGNIYSQRTALKSGFLPVWTEMSSDEFRG